jgi:hypothetical protein
MGRRDVDRKIISLAAATCSVVGTRDLRRAGVRRHAIPSRLASGWMAPMLPRTYGVGPNCASPSIEMRCMSAVLWGGEGASICAETAAAVRGWWDRGDGTIHVATHRGSALDAESGCVAHRVPKDQFWLPNPGSSVRATPLIAVPAMFLQLARTLTAWQVAAVICEARYHREITLEALDLVLAIHSGEPGAGTLRAAVQLVQRGSAGTRSRTEDEAVRLLGLAGVAMPVVNTRGAMGIPGDEPDFVWPRAGVNVEIDGGHHGETHQAQQDFARDEAARKMGWRVERVGHRDVWLRPAAFVRRVQRALGGGAGRKRHKRPSDPSSSHFSPRAGIAR